MNLAKTDMPPEFVSKLRRLNIREVETLLSMTATATGLMAIARVLNQSEADVRSLARRLAEDHPGIPVVPVLGELHAMGHRPPSR